MLLILKYYLIVQPKMKTTVKYNRFFAYSETENKHFYAEFKNNINIIYGKNTSGKSTLIQALNYTFGINDEKYKLNEILKENIIFRLDLEIKRDVIEKIIVIRDSDFIYIKRENSPILKYSGISGNRSESHKQLKEYLSDLLGFNLFLESKGEYKLAPIEVMFLPYYVSQDYGWVLVLKSFRDLEYYKNFKSDYYDYYLGISNEYDRIEKQNLENKKRDKENELKFLTNTERKNDKLQLSRLKDEAFVEKSADYIEKYKELKNQLIENEKSYIILSNQICFLEERKKVLNKVKRATKDQFPLHSNCPTCHQILPGSSEKLYEYFQDQDDTFNQINIIKTEIKEKTGSLNSIKKDIENLRIEISKDYSILSNYKIEGLTVEAWINNKANIALSNNTLKRIGELNIELEGINEELAKYKTDLELKQERYNKDLIFKQDFYKNLKMLNVNDFSEDYSLYKMNLFPQQGVELLKALLSYYFSFNRLIKDTTYVHRLPLVLDAIFKEDVDENNKGKILQFINLNKPKDTQIIFSIAESEDDLRKVEDYNKDYFGNQANLILINKNKTRAFLQDYNGEYNKLIEETLSLID